MPISFTDEQKNKLKDILKKKGKDLFATMGLKKTTIDDLAHAAHIAKGSFYAFFDSKEDLYFEIISDLEKEYQPKLTKILEDPQLSPVEALEQALLLQLHTVNHSPILLGLFRNETIQQLTLKMSAQKMEEHLAEHHIRWQKWFQKHKKDLTIKATEIPAACEACDNIFYLLLHQSGHEQHKSNPIEVLIKCFSRGLFKTKQETIDGND